MNSSSSFSPFADIYPDAKKIETVGSTCDSYVVRRYGKLHFVKKLKSDLSADPRYVAAIQKEFNVGYNLDHPNIVRYEKVGNDYIVLDYVDGRTLKEIIKEDREYFSNKRRSDKFVHQLLSAIGYMHQHSVVHLDLKPDNIMLTNVSNDVKVLDLGFCYTDSYNDTMGRTDKYAAPEQTDGLGNVDARTDIFAFGRILQQIPKLPHIYNKIADKCTNFDKSKRFQSVQDIEKYLDSSLEKRRRFKYSIFTLFAVLIIFSAFYIGTKYQENSSASKFDSIKVYTANSETLGEDSAKVKASSNVTSSNIKSNVTLANTATDTLQLFRNAASKAIQKIFIRTLATYRDSSYESSKSMDFEKRQEELKTQSHSTVLRISRKYPTISNSEIEQSWYNEINGILGSLGQAMLRNDGRVQ